MKTREPAAMQYLFPFMLGLTGLLMQVVVLRQFLNVFSGNELDIGITLAVWLASVGIGSFAGFRFRSPHALAVSVASVALLAQPTVTVIPFIGRLFSLLPGETVPLSVVLVSTVAVLFPLCASIGAQFPLAVSRLAVSPARVYGLEAAGAMTGGVVFTFFLAGNVGWPALSGAISFLCGLLVLLLVRKKALAVLLFIPVAGALGAAHLDDPARGTNTHRVKRADSKFGEIMLVTGSGQVNVYVSGKFHYSYPDSQTEELRAHLPMSVRPGSGRVLLVGGSPAVIREFLTYPLSALSYIEMDPVLLALSEEILSSGDRERLSDKRVRMISGDARRFLGSLRAAQYDLIVLNMPAPATANLNRFYTREFFREVRAALTPGGMLSLSLPVSYGYLGRRLQIANGSVYRTLRESFPYVEPSAIEYGSMFASDMPLDTRPETLVQNFSLRRINTDYVRPSVFEDAFAPLKSRTTAELLGGIRTINEDIRPVAYLHTVMVWAEVHGGKWLTAILALPQRDLLAAFILCLLVLAAVFARKKRSVLFAVVTTGYATMGFSIVSILLYQARFGYVYETIGLLIGTYMLGGAAGALAAGSVAHPRRWVIFSEAGMLVLFPAAVFLTGHELLFYPALFLAGLAGGIQFAAAAKIETPRKEEERGGILYASDLAGSFFGSLSVSIVMVPLAGMVNTLVLLGCMKALSLVLLLFFGGRGSG